MNRSRITIHRLGVSRASTKRERVLGPLPYIWLLIYFILTLGGPLVASDAISWMNNDGFQSIGILVALAGFVVLKLAYGSVVSRNDTAFLDAINNNPEAFARYMTYARAGLDATERVRRGKSIFISDEFLFQEKELKEPEWVSPE